MNITRYYLASYNRTYLNYIKILVLNFLTLALKHKLYNVFLYFKWQFTNSYNTQQVMEYRRELFTLLRSPFVDKKSREQLALIFFSTLIIVSSILNNKYLLFNVLTTDNLSFLAKQYYLRVSKKNCYMVRI